MDRPLTYSLTAAVSAAGASGVLLAIFVTATGDAASSGLTMRDSLAAGLARLQEVGGARVGDRTMVDALQPALDALGGGLSAAAAAARRGADRTRLRAASESRIRDWAGRRASIQPATSASTTSLPRSFSRSW